MRVPLQNRAIWITGASSGIGRELASQLITAGNRLFVTARSADRLASLVNLAPDRVTALEGDISDKESMGHLAEKLGQLTDHLDTVVLNAGGCEYIDATDIDIDIVERMMQVNYLGTVRCARIALPLLQRSTRAPHLVGVSSAAALTGLPRSEAYGSSKAALSHFFQALRLDLRPVGVEVSVVYPGFVDTPLTRRNDFPMPFLMNESEAAEAIITGMERRQREIAFPRKLIWPLKWLASAPAWLADRIGGKMVRAPEPGT